MEERSCPMCGGQLAMVRIKPELYFYINEKGQVERDTNHDFGGVGPISEYQAICTQDRTHDIWPLLGTPEFEDMVNWCEEFENVCNSIIRREGLY